MTDTRHTQPRCAICRWPYRPNGDGCEPGNCSFRPAEGSPEYTTNALRLAAYGRLRIAGNPTPTPEDVDAELAPKGLQVLKLTEPVWVGEWDDLTNYVSVRRLLRPAEVGDNPFLTQCEVMQQLGAPWGFDATRYRGVDIKGKGYDDRETAKQACEAAIVAAWRNR